MSNLVSWGKFLALETTLFCVAAAKETVQSITGSVSLPLKIFCSSTGMLCCQCEECSTAQRNENAPCAPPENPPNQIVLHCMARDVSGFNLHRDNCSIHLMDCAVQNQHASDFSVFFPFGGWAPAWLTTVPFHT